MKENLIYTTSGKAHFEDVTNPLKLDVLKSFITSWEDARLNNELDETAAREFFTEAVILNCPNLAIIHGIKSVSCFFSYYIGFIQFRYEKLPLVAIYSLLNTSIEDSFCLEIFDRDGEELYYSFTVKFYGSKIGELVPNHSIIEEVFLHYLEEMGNLLTVTKL